MVAIMSTLKYNYNRTVIPAPIESITGIWEFTRPPFTRSTANSLPGHLLHLVTKGRYRLKTNRREYEIEAGDIIYYHEVEDVTWIGGEEEVTFYSVGFNAPGMKPFPIDSRVLKAPHELQNLFQKLYFDYQKRDQDIEFILNSYLLEILYRIRKILHNQNNNTINIQEELWWKIERIIRKRRIFRPSLDELADLTEYSKISIIRSCRKNTGETPIKRVRTLRMEEAKGVLMFSKMSISEIAHYLDYPRVHEFSRDFSLFFKKSPTQYINDLK